MLSINCPPRKMDTGTMGKYNVSVTLGRCPTAAKIVS